MRRATRWPALFLLLLGACYYEDLTPPALAQPWTPSPAVLNTFAQWWHEDAQCLGWTQHDSSEVRYFLVPVYGGFATDAGGLALGLDIGQDIYLDKGDSLNALIVRHEMMHAMIDPVPGHPAWAFTGCHLTWATYTAADSARDYALLPND